MNSFDTPAKIKEQLISLSGKQICELPYKTLSLCVRNLSFTKFPLYIANNTSSNQIYNVYLCSFHNPPESCKSKIVYKVDNGTISISNYDWIHNHSMHTNHRKRYRNRYSIDLINKIGLQSEMGLTPGMIRIRNMCAIPSQHLYSISKKFRVVDKNEMLTAYQTVNRWPNWKNYFFTRNEVCGSLFCYSMETCHSSYACDIVVVDDTAKTNKFELPLMTAVAIDENGKSRLLGFGFLFGKCTDDYEMFFNYLKDNINGDIRLFISDRSMSQNLAYRRVFPQADYIFCKIHILRNVNHTMGHGAIYSLFDNIYKDPSLENQLIETLLIESKKTENPKQTKFINTLLNHKDHWIPSSVNKKFHNDNLTSNRVEGTFGHLKTMLLGQKLTISTVSTAMKIIHDIPKDDAILPILPTIIINPETLLGLIAKEYLLTEYNKMANSTDFRYCDCVKYFELPCFHEMLVRIQNNTIPIISISDVNKRYLKQHNESELPNSTNIVEAPTPKEDWSYNTCCSKFEKYFDLAHRNELIRNKLEKSLQELSSIEIPSESSTLKDPPYISNSGAKFKRPRQNVDLSGAKLKKKRYKCSLCCTPGHNASKCPKKQIQKK